MPHGITGLERVKNENYLSFTSQLGEEDNIKNEP
jgi:hypothetical protein